MLSLNDVAASSDPLMRSLDSCVTRQQAAGRSHEAQAATPHSREGAWSGSGGDSSRGPSSTGAASLAATYPPGPAVGGAATGAPARRGSPARQATASRLRLAASVGYQAMHQAHVEAAQQQVRNGRRGCLCWAPADQLPACILPFTWQPLGAARPCGRHVRSQCSSRCSTCE